MKGQKQTSKHSVKVLDMNTGEFIASYSCTPREAVVCAYAQFSRNDFNTWEYGKYDFMVEEGQLTFAINNYCVLKNGRD